MKKANQNNGKIKAVMRNKYGGPQVLEIKEIDKPVAGKKEILVKVHAATVNRTDLGFLRGKPKIIRLFSGLFKPKEKFKITGTDFAGVVEDIGENVEKFKPGDKVFGFSDNGLGTHSQYITLNEKTPMALIPDGLNYNQAAACPEGAHYAINFIKKIKVNEHEKVLVNGATGAIGSAMVQILKYYGANITATANTKNIKLIKSLGADKVIDYENEDFTKLDEKFDYVLDAVGKSSFNKCKPLLKEHGLYLSSELGPGNENVYLPITTKLFSKKKVKFPVPKDVNASLDLITMLIEKDKFKPVIDKTYKLENIKDAFEYVATEKKTGNVIVEMGD